MNTDQSFQEKAEDMRPARLPIHPACQQFALYCPIGISGATLNFLACSLLLKEAVIPYQAANAAGCAGVTSATPSNPKSGAEKR